MSMTLLHPDFRLDEADVLVFVHVPKCGGSSVHRFLGQALGGRYVNVYEQLVQAGLEDHRSRFERALGIGGHYGIDQNPGLSFLPGRVPRYMSIVREPVARFVSHFRYYTRSPNSGVLAKYPEVREFSLQDYIAFLRRRNDTYHVNVQTRMLTGQAMFDEGAKAILEDRYLGLVPTEELFVFFRRFARHGKGPANPPDSFRENVSPAVDDIQIDERSLAYIYESSRQDLKLYHFAREWFAEALVELTRGVGVSARGALQRGT